MIEIHNTKDFASKLKSLIRAHNTLEDAGLDPDSRAFDATVEAFLAQYEAATPARVEVPLPPAIVDPSKIEPAPVGYVARTKVSKLPVHATLSSNVFQAERDLNNIIPAYRRLDYEIAPLFFKNDR